MRTWPLISVTPKQYLEEHIKQLLWGFRVQILQRKNWHPLNPLKHKHQILLVSIHLLCITVIVGWAWGGGDGVFLKTISRWFQCCPSTHLAFGNQFTSRLSLIKSNGDSEAIFPNLTRHQLWCMRTPPSSDIGSIWDPPQSSATKTLCLILLQVLRISVVKNNTGAQSAYDLTLKSSVRGKPSAVEMWRALSRFWLFSDSRLPGHHDKSNTVSGKAVHRECAHSFRGEESTQRDMWAAQGWKRVFIPSRQENILTACSYSTLDHICFGGKISFEWSPLSYTTHHQASAANCEDIAVSSSGAVSSFLWKSSSPQASICHLWVCLPPWGVIRLSRQRPESKYFSLCGPYSLETTQLHICSLEAAIGNTYMNGQALFQ